MKYCWETRIATTIEVKRHHSDVEETIARLRSFCSMLCYASEGREELRWLSEQPFRARKALENAFEKERFILREASGWRHVHEGLADCRRVLFALVKGWKMGSESLQEPVKRC